MVVEAEKFLICVIPFVRFYKATYRVDDGHFVPDMLAAPTFATNAKLPYAVH